MSGLRLIVGVALAASALALPSLRAQQPPAGGAAPAQTPTQIRNEIEKIKKGRTIAILPADGIEDTEGATVIRFDNPSPYDLIVLLVGPTIERVDLGPDRTQTLTVQPGDYEIAVTVAGRDLPPFYCRQSVAANMRFSHKFVIPAF